MNRLNADKIKDALLKEISNARVTGCREVDERLNKTEDRRRKLLEMVDAKRQRSKEVDLLMSQNDKLFQSAEPAELEDLSRSRVKLAQEKTEIEALVSDLETRLLPAIDNNLLKIRTELNDRVCGFMYALKRRFQDEVYLLVHDVIEPQIMAWQETFDAVSPEYNLGGQGLIRDIQFHSPLILEACDKNSSHALYMRARDLQNGKKPGEE